MNYKPAIVIEWFKANSIPRPVAEYRFHADRKWRFDFAWPEHRIALEVEGGAFTNGRHTRGSGFVADIEKYNAAALAGWRVFRVIPSELCMPETVEMISGAMRFVWYAAA